MRSELHKEFEDKSWSGKRGRAPRSGWGSSLPRTQNLRNALPGIFDRYNVKHFFDAPCGDWFWMQHVDLTGMAYTGADISNSVIEQNKATFTAPNLRFEHFDITSDPLPAADMMMCRECLFHLKWYLRWDFFANFVKADIPYLMMNICHVKQNKRLMRSGGYKPFNPMLDPFLFPEPLEIFVENENICPADEDGNRADRSMGIWSKAQVQDTLDRRALKLQKATQE